MRIVLVLLVSILAACGEQSQAAGKDALDHAAKAAAAAKEMVVKSDALVKGTAAFAALKQELAKVTDGASAQQVKAQLATHLAQVKASLGKLGDLDQIADDLLAKAGTSRAQLFALGKAQVDALAAKPEVAKALGGLLDDLKQLVK
jgi:hypothetical protein